MGAGLLKFYEYVYGLQGLEGKSKLARETRMPTIKAAFQPDSPQNLQIFERATAKITGRSVPKL